MSSTTSPIPERETLVRFIRKIFVQIEAFNIKVFLVFIFVLNFDASDYEMSAII